MIKTILWDVDGTLLDFLASQSSAIKSAYRHFGLGECSDELIEQYSAINLKYWEGLERGEYTKKEVLIGRFEEFLSLHNINSVTPEEFCLYYESRLTDTIVYIDDSLNLLKALSKNYKQYAVTNGAYNVQTEKLFKSGFSKIFDGIFISDEVGFEKPSENFFDYVMTHIDAQSTDEIIIVGDSLTSDIKGGNNMGIKTCWYNPKHNPINKPVKVDYQISHLSEITKILNLHI